MKTKRFYLLLIVIFVAILLAACGAPAAAPTATSIPPSSVPPTDTPFPPTDTPVPPEPTVIPAAKEAASKGSVETIEITSQALAGNLLGSTVTRPLVVYLPPGYGDSDKTYPVVYLLAAFTADADGMSQWVDVENFDRMLADGAIDEMIIVFVDGLNSLDGSYYMSSPTIGDWDTFIAEELVAFVDKHYRTIAHRDARGITGHSMGADGAMHMALKYPDIFGVVAASAGLYNYDHEWFKQAITSNLQTIPEQISELSNLNLHAQIAIALASGAASNPDDPPFYLDLPFSIVDGQAQIVNEVWDEVVGTDILHDLNRYAEQSVELNNIAFFHGVPDTVASIDMARSLDKAMTELNVEHQFVENDLQHLQMDVDGVFQSLSDHLAFEMPEKIASDILSGYADNDGVKIYYEVEGEGPPLVLVHWETGSTKDWRMFGYVDALKDDYQLIMVDTRGHGKSDKPDDPAAYDAETQARDIVSVLDELGIDKTHYFGYSLGGRLGWGLAKYAPERLHSLIIGGNSPTAYDASEWAAWLIDTGVEDYAHIVEDGARNIGVWHPDIYAVYAANDLEAVTLATGEPHKVDYTKDLADMSMPILLLVGTYDEDYPGMLSANQNLPNPTFVSMLGLDPAQTFLLSAQALPYITEFLAEVSAESEMPAAELDSETVDKIEMAAQIMMANDKVPGLAIGIIKDGKVVYAEGFGEAELGSDRAVTSQTLFHLASVNKTATATALLQLVEQGKIDLDAPVTDYLPYFKMADERYQDITIRQLLSHTSGMPDPDGAALTADFMAAEDDDGALERYVQGLSAKSLLFAPGEAWEYSCVGFDVLGDVIAKVSGQSYEDYMQENIFTPLGMVHTTALLEETDPESVASPHIIEADEVVINPVFPYSRVHGPCNNLYSNSEDMARYALAHLNRGELDGVRILPASVYDEMWSPSAESTWAEWFGPMFANYGFGWFVGETAGNPAVSHVGGDPGFQSEIALFPEEGVAIVVMLNLFDPEQGDILVFELTDTLMDLFSGMNK